MKQTKIKLQMTSLLDFIESECKSKSECNKTLDEGHYKTSRNKYETERKLRKYTDIELCIHATFENYFWYTASYIS